MSCRWAIWVLLFVTLPVQAQFRSLTDPDIRISERDEFALFFQWEGTESIETFSVRLPAGWTLLDAATGDDRGQFLPAVLEPSSSETGLWFIHDEDGNTLSSGVGVRLSIQSGAESAMPVQIAPAELRDGALAHSVRQQTEVLVSVNDRPERSENLALQVSDDSIPLLLRTPKTMDLSTEDTWTLAFRMRSAGLSQTVLSSWTGYESDPYPVEAVVDGSGHVTIFTNRGDGHFAMRSNAPLADGSWHHLVVTHDGVGQHMTFIVDGVPADSLHFKSSAAFSQAMPPVVLGGRLETSRMDLSSPFRGELDDVALSASIIDKSAIREWIKTGRLVTDRPVWSIDFDTPASAERNGLEWANLRLVPSPLIFRKAASNVRAEQVVEGVMLSFLPGDDSVAWYEIEVSTDGHDFQPAARLEGNVAVGSRLEWLDRSPAEAVLHYRVSSRYDDATLETSPIIKVGLGTDAFESRVLLEGNFPNPFNPTTTIRYEVFEREHVRVSVWDLAGQMIAQPVDVEHGPGHYEVGFDAGTLPSGTYFVRLESASGIQTHQMILMK